MDPVQEILGITGSLLIMLCTLFENFLHVYIGRIREFSIFVGIYPTPSLHMQEDFRNATRVNSKFPAFQNLSCTF